MQSEVIRAESGFTLKKPAEIRWVVKMEFVADFSNSVVGMRQKAFCFKGDFLSDDLAGCRSGILLYKIIEVRFTYPELLA